MNISSSDLKRLKNIRLLLPLKLGREGEWLANFLGLIIAADAPRRGVKSSAKGIRNELIRQHDREFNAVSQSLRARARAIEHDLKRASSSKVEMDLRTASAKMILQGSSKKSLSFRQIMTIIQ